jgi:error-prone DNA polymerase
LGLPAISAYLHSALPIAIRWPASCAHEAAKVTGVHLIVGCRVDLEDFPSMPVYPTDRPSYSRLCRLLRWARAGPAKVNAPSLSKMSKNGSRGDRNLCQRQPHETLSEDLAKFRDVFGARGLLRPHPVFAPARSPRKKTVRTITILDGLFSVGSYNF